MWKQGLREPFQQVCLLPGMFDKMHCCKGLSTVIVMRPQIKDQVRAMTERNVKAVFIVVLICEGEYQLIFMSSESLLTDQKW